MRKVYGQWWLSGLVGVLAVLACAPASTPAPAPPATSALAAPAASAPAAPAAASPAPPARLAAKIAYGSIAGNNLPLWAAKEGGFLEQYGLDVPDLPLIEGGTLVIQALLAGDTDIVLAGSSGIIAAALQGADLVMFAGSSSKFDFALMSVPHVRTAGELKGGRVGVSRFGSSSDFAARSGLQILGLDPDRDVSLLQIGGTGQRLGAMQSGAIDAAPEISPVLLTARKLGFNVLVDLAESGVPYEVGPMSASRALIAQNPEIVRRYVRAHLAAIHRAKVDQAFGTQVIRKYMHSDDLEVAEATWQHFALGSIPEVPYLTDAALAPVLQEAATTEPRAASARPDQFYDNSFLREAEDSGFVRQLYGR